MIKIRLAELDDYDFFYAIKAEKSNIFWTGHDAPPDYAQMKIFFEGVVAGASQPSNRKIYIVLNNEESVGHLYLNPDGENVELAPAIMERFWGHGYAKQAMMLGLEEAKRLGFTQIVTRIREDNIASLHTFKACGIEITDQFIMTYIPKLHKEVKMFIAKKEL